jgi:Spy/CpxP family protein refolding chaperone
MIKNSRELTLTAAVISISVSVGLGLSLAPSASAQNNPPNNDFGEGASDLGTSGQMGGHASNQQEPRSRIGNVGQDIACPDPTQKIHPDQLARILTGQEALFAIDSRGVN